MKGSAWWSAAADWFIAEGSGAPRALMEALATVPARSILTGILVDDLPCLARVQAGHLAGRAFMPGRGLGGGSDFEYLRMSYAEAAAWLASPEAPIDGLLVQVAPVADGGTVSFGLQAGLAEAALAGGARVVAQINPQLPVAAGAPRIPRDLLAGHVTAPAPLRDMPAREATDADRRIAESVAALIPDGATLEIGIGSVPDAVYAALRGHRRLTIRSGMVSDGVQPLVESAALHPTPADGAPPVTATMLLGSAPFYRWAAEQRQVAIRPTAWTHDRARLAGTRGFVAVNSAVEVALTGDVNAEYVAGRYVSGLGGLPDFAAAASAAEGGMSIIALPSVTRSGRPRIVPALQSPQETVPGAQVTHVVTEWGVAKLDADPERRAAALAAIAHPDHRESLVT